MKEKTCKMKEKGGCIYEREGMSGERKRKVKGWEIGDGRREMGDRSCEQIEKRGRSWRMEAERRKTWK